MCPHCNSTEISFDHVEECYKMLPYKHQEAQLLVPCDNPNLRPNGFQLVKDPSGMKGLYWQKRVWR